MSKLAWVTQYSSTVALTSQILSGGFGVILEPQSIHPSLKQQAIARGIFHSLSRKGFHARDKEMDIRILQSEMLASQTQETTLALMMRGLGMIRENPATDDGM